MKALWEKLLSVPLPKLLAALGAAVVAVNATVGLVNDAMLQGYLTVIGVVLVAVLPSVLPEYKTPPKVGPLEARLLGKKEE